MKTLYSFVIICVCVLAVSAQDIYKLKSSKINFFAGTPLEDIDANNTKTTSFLNIKTGEITISIPNKEFVFKRSLMQEHFNENYMETAKYPKSEFKGKIKDIESIDFTKTEPITIVVEGTLTVHGIAKERSIEVTLKNNAQLIEGVSKFVIPLSDHNINRPQILWEKIAENVQISATFTYEPYKK